MFHQAHQSAVMQQLPGKIQCISNGAPTREEIFRVDRTLAQESGKRNDFLDDGSFEIRRTR